MIITEVTNFLYQSSTVAGMNATSSSAASTPTALASSLAASNVGGAAYNTVSAMTPTGPATMEGLGSLNTMFHVRWVMEIVGQAFSFPLEDINVVCNAAAIYIQWLVEPTKRPPVIQRADDETQQQFIQALFRHVSLLFKPKKVDGVGAAKPLLATMASKHVDLCKLMLRTLSQVAVASASKAGALDGTLVFTTSTWKVLLRMLLGITDYLLKMPSQPYCYLPEELGEQLLSTFVELWLRSQIFSASLWRALKSLYPRWTHRMLAVTQWNAVSLALTQRINKILYGQGTNAVVYTVYSNLVTLELSNQYAVYAWHQVLHLIGKPDNLSPQIFFRSVLGIEKLVQIFHSIGHSSQDGGIIERHFPDGNTILHLFGSWLFDAVSRDSSECAEGRAQAFGILCRIFSRPQRRSPFLATYLYQFYSAVIEGLKGDLLSLVFIIVNCEDIFALGLPGVRILIAPLVSALRRIIPNLEKQLRVSLNMDDLRRACYKLLCTMFSFCDHFGQASVRTIDSVGLYGLQTITPSNGGELAPAKQIGSPAKSDMHLSLSSPASTSALATNEHSYSYALKKVYQVDNNQVALTGGYLFNIRYWIMDTLMASFISETDPGNLRYLINSLTSFAIDDAKRSPKIISLLVRLFEEQLCLTKWPVDVSLVAIESLRQLAPFKDEVICDSTQDVSKLVVSLCGLVQALIARNNLPTFFKLISSLFDCILDWIFGVSLGSNWFSTDLDCQAAVVHVFTRAIVHGNATCRKLESNPTATSDPQPPVGSTTDSRSKKSAPNPGNLGSRSAASLVTMSTKSLDAQLAATAEIALAKLLQYFGSGTSNPFNPIHSSTLVNECLLLGKQTEQEPLGFISGKPKTISSLSREELQSLRYFILNGSTIVCFLERPIQPGLSKSHLKGTEAELVVLLRSFAGRFCWETLPIYTLNPQSLESLLTCVDESNDPLDEADLSAPSCTAASNPSDLFFYSNVFADSFTQQAALAEQNPDLKALPIQLDQIGPLYNDTVLHSRFSQDDKRLLNFACIDNLAKLQIEKTKSKLLSSGASLRNYRVRQPKRESPESQYPRILLAQMGFALLKNRDSALRVSTCPELLSDLEILDSLPERETISCSVFYVRSGRQTLAEILTEEKVSLDYLQFVHSLGWPIDLRKHPGWCGAISSKISPSAPYYANNSVEMVFHVPCLMDVGSLGELIGAPGATQSGLLDQEVPSHASGLYKIISNDLVSVLWIEDLQEMLTLPSKFQTRSIVYICVSPLQDAESAGLYRIRIMVTSTGSSLAAAASPSAGQQQASPDAAASSESAFLFGPLLDGMIIRRESLGRLVRETVISACLFCLYSIQNQPHPYQYYRRSPRANKLEWPSAHSSSSTSPTSTARSRLPQSKPAESFMFIAEIDITTI